MFNLLVMISLDMQVAPQPSNYEYSNFISVESAVVHILIHLIIVSVAWGGGEAKASPS